MREELENIALVEAFLEGKLQGAELSGFESRIAIDPDLSFAVDFQRVVMEATIRSGRSKISDELNRAYELSRPETSFQWNSAKGYLLGAAMAGMMGGGIYLLTDFNASPEVVPEKQELPEAVPGSVTGPEGDKDGSTMDVVNKNAGELTLEILESAGGEGMMYIFDKGRLSLYGDFDVGDVYVEELFNNGKYYLHYNGEIYLLDETPDKKQLNKETDPEVLELFK